MFAMTAALAVFGGGEDSASLLAALEERYKRLQPLHIWYTERAETIVPSDASSVERAQLEAHVRDVGKLIVKECELWFAWPSVVPRN